MIRADSVFECLRNPKEIEQERREAKENAVLPRVVRQSLMIGQQMLGSLEMGEYVSERNREVVADQQIDNDAKNVQKNAGDSRRSAASKRRLAEMQNDVDDMYNARARSHSEAEF